MRQSSHRLIYIVGDWKPPLGIALRADGLSAAMMVTMAIVICAVAVFAHADFGTRAGSTEARAPFAFWILLMAIWGAMKFDLPRRRSVHIIRRDRAAYLRRSAAGLPRRPAETLQAALRYLLFALLGSILYLVGTALLYGSYATLDIVLLSRRVHLEPATLVAATLMTIGLLPRPRSFHCIYGCRQPMPVRRRPQARFCRRWW